MAIVRNENEFKIFSELKKILDNNITKKLEKKLLINEIPVLFPKIFDYPFTYKSEISEHLNPVIL